MEKNTVAGYLSEQNKRKFTIAAGIISAVFILAQFIVPMILMMLAMPALMFSSAFQIKIAHPERGAYWDDTIWYIESIQSFHPSAQPQTTLNRLTYDDGLGSEVIAEIPFQDSWLLADNDILWIISSSGVAYYSDGDMQIITDSQNIGDISRPFIFNNVPAVIEENPNGFSLMLFENSRWTDMDFFTVKHLEGPQCGIRDIQVVSGEEKLSFFVRLGQTIFYRDGLPSSEDTDRSEWQPVIQSGSNWYSMLYEDKPAVFFNHSSQNLSEVSGMMLEDDHWQPFFSYKQSFPGDMGIFFTEAPDYFYLLLQGMPGSLKLLEFEGSKMLAKYRHGSGFPFPKSMIGIMVIPQIGILLMPLILAYILSGLMFKHRITVHKANSNQMLYASLVRRAAAQLVDTAIVLGPSFLIGLYFLFSFWDMEEFLFSDPANIAGFFWHVRFQLLVDSYMLFHL